MAPPAALNPEPSQPVERKQQHLPPKTYVDAAEENLDIQKENKQSAGEIYAGQGEDEAPRSPQRNMHKKSGSLRANGHSKDKKENNVVVERFMDKDGEHLVSTTHGWDNERNKPYPARRNSELVSGRKAGARWEQSQYVIIAPDWYATDANKSLLKHPLRASLRAPKAPPPNSPRPRPHPQHSDAVNRLLLPLRHPALLAHPPSLRDLHPPLQRPLIRHTLPPLQLPPLPSFLVPLRLLLPRPPPPLRSSSPYPQVHLRLPPPRHNIPRCLRRLRHRSPRLLPTIPRHHKHPPHSRFQLPRPTLPRIRPSNGPRLRVPRVLREPPLPRRAQ